MTMEYGPKSGSEDIGPDSHNFHMSEHLAMNRATILWDGPKHMAYNSKAARFRSYTNWPQGMNPSPDYLSTAGFFFSGKHYKKSRIYNLYYSNHFLKHILLTGLGDITHCFHCGGILHD